MLLANLHGINLINHCQQICQFMENCQYFMYDTELQNCMLFDSSKRDCDVSRGPPVPIFENCVSKSTTTTTSSSTTITTTTTTTPTTRCRDITIDACDCNQYFEITNVENMEKCQNLCSKNFSNQCRFFIFDRKNSVCLLYDFIGNDFIKTCNGFGSSNSPPISQCLNSNDPCVVSVNNLSKNLSKNYKGYP